MASIYTKVFQNIFEESSKFLIHDFIELKGQKNENDGRKNFCISAYKKIFDVAVNHLYKEKYNGELVIPEKVFLTRSDYVFGENIVNQSSSMKKNISVPQKNKEGKIEYVKERMIKLITNGDDGNDIQNPIIKLSNAREEKDIKSRIVLIPIDGLTSFYIGKDDFAVVLVLQQKDNKDNNFSTQQVMVYSPFSRDVFSFDKVDGFRVNGAKIADRNIMPVSKIDTIFVDNYSKQFSFNINKLWQISDVCLSSTSIFYSLGLLSSSSINLLVYHKNDDGLIQNIIECCIKCSSFDSLQIGEHILIGSTKVLERFAK